MFKKRIKRLWPFRDKQNDTTRSVSIMGKELIAIEKRNKILYEW